MKKAPTETIEVRLSELKDFPGNAKIHTAEQIEHLKNSFKTFGFVQPIIIDENKTILAGHGRVMAARELGLEAVPCVQVLDFTEEEKTALNVADNKLHSETAVDEEMALKLLKELSDEGYEMLDFGLYVNDGKGLEEQIDSEKKGEEPSIKSIGMFLPSKDYERVVRVLREAQEEMDLENHSEVFLRLLNEYA